MFKLSLDGPGSIDHEYRGEKLRIAFRWKDGVSAPTGIVISPANQPSDDELIIYDIFEGSWNSYGQAEKAGIERAEGFIDSHWVVEGS
ncbi:hypothetical protein QAO71_10660 [Halopseudomonas sp. SMJS2]|uniref:hypothetical protein n=1 Tax=Halopseudomonas sp. SMJS2 TaxID=3041098 RepID=UPI002452DBDE|nr:hypothetical protein [Halopseudomonas sp. SMJS2]WGK60554.1 hypothetical protein QAO71_10660 [Halopseudomonas sp. SMJS2]